MERLAKTRFADAHQILAREGGNAVSLRIGTRQDNRRESGLFIGIEPRRASIAPAIVKPVQAMRVVADHRIPQRGALLMPAASAAFFRLMPDSAFAIASSRRAARGLASALASLRSAAGVRSFLMTSAVMCPPSESMGVRGFTRPSPGESHGCNRR